MRTWLDMLCLAERGDKDLLAVAGGPEVTAVRGRRKPDVTLGTEVGGVTVIKVIHAKDLIRL